MAEEKRIMIVMPGTESAKEPREAAAQVRAELCCRIMGEKGES